MIYNRIIVVFRLSAIGDVIIATKAIQLLALNGYYPVLVTSHSMLQICQSMPLLKAFICMENTNKAHFYLDNKAVNPNEFSQFINSVKVKNPPLFLDLQKTSRSKKAINHLKKLIKYEKIYSVSKKTFYRIFLIFITFLFSSQKKKTAPFKMKGLKTIHVLQENIIKKIIINDKNEFIKNTKMDSHHSLSSRMLGQNDKINNYVCLFPGASGLIKMWPKENFRILIQLILNQTDFTVVLCGAQSEIKIGEYLDFPNSNRVLNLIHKTDIQQSLHLIANAAYIVTNDSFPAHAAEAFGIPATVLFGSTSPKFGFAPKADNITIEYLNLACSPCTRHGKIPCRYKNLKCLKDISAEKVFAAFISHL